jgi:hypothetical protein
LGEVMASYEQICYQPAATLPSNRPNLGKAGPGTTSMFRTATRSTPGAVSLKSDSLRRPNFRTPTLLRKPMEKRDRDAAYEWMQNLAGQASIGSSETLKDSL